MIITNEGNVIWLPNAFGPLHSCVGTFDNKNARTPLFMPVNEMVLIFNQSDVTIIHWALCNTKKKDFLLYHN